MESLRLKTYAYPAFSATPAPRRQPVDTLRDFF
jgi:hypothetical protein